MSARLISSNEVRKTGISFGGVKVLGFVQMRLKMRVNFQPLVTGSIEQVQIL